MQTENKTDWRLWIGALFILIFGGLPIGQAITINEFKKQAQHNNRDKNNMLATIGRLEYNLEAEKHKSTLLTNEVYRINPSFFNCWQVVAKKIVADTIYTNVYPPSRYTLDYFTIGIIKPRH